MSDLARYNPAANRLHRNAAAGGGLAALRRSPLMLRLLVIAALLIFWEVGARLYDNPRFLASFTDMLAAFPQVIGNPGVRAALLAMFGQLAVAYLMALSAALIAGIIVGRSRTAYQVFFPLILLAYAFPLVTILPLFVLVFGIGATSKIAFGFTAGFFPIVVNVISGSQNVSPVLQRLGLATGASRLQMYWHIVVPHLVPSLFVGMRLGMTGTLLGVILAELYATRFGVGYYTSLYADRFDPASMFALIATIAAFAITVNELLRKVERRVARWRSV